jgi:hypothetical protein
MYAGKTYCHVYLYGWYLFVSKEVTSRPSQPVSVST